MSTRSRRLLAALLSAGACWPMPALHAQPAPVPTADARIRVWAPPRADGHEGTLLTIDTTAVGNLVWMRPARRRGEETVIQINDTIPLTAVERLEVYRQRAGGRRIGEGMLVGLLVGVAGGALVGRSADCSNGDAMCGLYTLVTAAGGGLFGGLVGGIVGSTMRRPPVGSWEAVAVPRRGSVAPARRGVLVSVPF